MLLYRLSVCECAIAFVSGKAVLGKFFVQACHICIPVDFGDYGSGGDDRMKLVAFDDSLLIFVFARGVEAAVEKDGEARIWKLELGRKLLETPGDCDPSGIGDTPFVDDV